MKITNEVKVGLLAVGAIVILILGFNFLKGNNIFSKPVVLFARFADIGTLDRSNQVRINGLPVGTVYEISQADQKVDYIIAEVHLTRDVLIPKKFSGLYRPGPAWFCLHQH